MTNRRNIILLVLVLIIAIVLLYRTFASAPRGTTSGASTPSVTAGEPQWDVQTKMSGCLAHGGLADSACPALTASPPLPPLRIGTRRPLVAR